MNELHIHEVLRMMISTQKTYSGKADFIQDITTQFGADVEFHACSASGMNIEEAYDFLLQRGKISLNAEEAVGIAPDMTMCDENGHHDHDHDHDHSH